MNRVECLEAARQAVAERGLNYGTPESNFSLIARLWSAWLGVEVKAHDVAIMMSMLKAARLKTTPTHIDSWVDGGAYFACGAEVATASRSDRILTLSRGLTDPRRDEDDGA